MIFHDVGRGSASAYFQKVSQGLNKIRSEAEVEKRDLSSRAAQPGYLPNRVPWVMSTTEWLEQGWGIQWWSNPSDVTWNIRLRQSTSKNANSTVTHVWANNNRGTHFDEFVLNMNLQSGNLIPFNRNNPVEASSRENAIAPGLVNFYDFLKLLDAPKLTEDGRTNHVIIKYHSNIFPSLTLIGQFEAEGVRFSDNSNDPTNISAWSCSFIVYDTNPRISDNTRNTINSDLLSTTLSRMYYPDPTGGLRFDTAEVYNPNSGVPGIDPLGPIEPQQAPEISGLSFNPITGKKF